MSILVSAHQLSKSFSARKLFDGLSFTIESGDRIGLIGPNGAGKSTLLRILSGRDLADGGKLSFQQGLRIGYLEQVPTFTEGQTILESVLGDVDAEDWEAHGAAQEYLSRFHLKEFGEDTPVQSLSGGWRKRVALARELVKKPDLLLLDEPTNHLDVEGVLWLETYLSRAGFAVLTITHDRLFLQRVANQILELDRRHAGGLLKVQGDYAQYLQVREQLISAQERREVILKNTLRRETEWLRQGAKARTTKQRARIDRAGELKDTVEDLSLRNRVQAAGIDFQEADRSPKKLVEAEGLSKSYGDQVIFSDLDLKITPKSRIGLLGTNGAGKSTLIRVLMGLEPPTSGKVFRADRIQVAYFDQTREALDPDLTVTETLCPKGSHVEFQGKMIHIKGYLDRFLFDQNQAEMKVGKLSGGEQSRLLIARLMLRPANLLVLDEPTNDLDLATLGVLEECLQEFNGAVILVTHDRYFLDQVTDQLLAFPAPDFHERRLTSFANLEQWESWRKEESKSQRVPKESKAKAEASAAAPSKKKRLGYKEQRELDAMEETIHRAEELLKRLSDESVLPQNVSNAKTLGEIAAKMAEAQAEIDRLYERWAELEQSQT